MKAKFFALAALVLGLASCTQDVETVTPVGGEVDFQLSVAAPELAGTRAGDAEGKPQNALDSSFGAIDYLQGSTDGDLLRTDWGDVDLRYTLEVYDVKNGQVVGTDPVKDRQVIIKDTYEPVVFDLRLVPKREYRFVVFADFVENNKSTLDAKAQLNVEGLHHTIGETLASITIKNDAINNEVTDAYFATKDIVIESAASQDIILKRPYGKVRVIATDLAELNLNVNPAAVEVKYTAKHPQTFNALTGEIGSWENVNYEFASVYNAISTEVDEGGLSNHFYTVGYDAEKVKNLKDEVRHSHMTLFTDYILAEDQQTPINFTMTVYDKYVEKDHAENSIIKSTTFNTAIPVGRNKLTTVIGNVLTTATDVNVRIDDNFGNAENITDKPYYVEILSGEVTETKVLETGTYCFEDIEFNVANGAAIEVKGDVVIDVMGVMTIDSKKGIVVDSGSLVINGVVETRSANRGGILNIEVEEGSAIGGGNITIQNLAGLTAKANGKHAFGIGAANATVVIKNTKIDYVAGGYIQPLWVNDTKYGKSEPEGGAAIGGAHITIEDSEIVKAEGGSKAAAIGNKFWTGTNIVIKNSTLGDIFGGNASAAIGGSRYNGEDKHNISIEIEDSTITNAVGGQAGAGIGSGYDTHCNQQNYEATNNIVIKNSNIKAKGGKNAAGIGTGYHSAYLTGSIDAASTIEATRGDEPFYKNTYTVSQNIGYGIVDPAREFSGANAEVTFTVAGKVIATPAIEVNDAASLATALKADRKNISVVLTDNIELPITSLGQQTGGSGEYKLGGESTEYITIDLGGKKLNITTTYWSAIGAKNADALFTIKNGTMTSTGNSAGTWNAWDVRFSNCNYAIEDVAFEKAVALDNAGKSTTMKNVTITDNHQADTYGLWITAEGQTVTLENVTMDMTPAKDGRGIKIDEQYVGTPAKVTLTVKNSTFKTDEKAAIMVGSSAGAMITVDNLNITEVAEDSSNEVWVDEDYVAYVNKVDVVGGSMIVEGVAPIEGDTADARQAALNTAVTTANAVVQLPAGEYKMPNDIAAGVTIVCDEGVVFTTKNLNINGATISGATFENGGNAATGTVNGTFLGCTFNGSNGLRNCYVPADKELLFDGCVFYGDTYGVHFDGGNNTGHIVFKNCDFTGWNSFASTVAKVEFYNCDFHKSSYGKLRFYQDGVMDQCVFDDECNIDFGDTGNTVYFTNCSSKAHEEFAQTIYRGDIKDNTLYINGKKLLDYGLYLVNENEYEVSSKAGMFWFANEVNVNKNAFSGKTVKLAADIDLENEAWTPVGQTGATTFNGVFDGQNYTISNINVNSEAQTGANYSSGLFGWVESHTAGHGHLKNVNINGATIIGHHNCGALVGYITQQTALVENCHVTGAAVSCTYANGDADGDKAGALIGNATVATPVKNCTAANSTVSAGRDAGQVIGAAKEANVTGCSATEVTVEANGTGTGNNVRNEVIGRLLN